MNSLTGAVGKAGRLKPETRLALAVSEFEASLSSTQKATLRNYKTQALSSPPSFNDVTRLVAELNSSCSRPLGTRFVNVMAAIQQFASFGDVIVGGSQNIIACSVWGLVRVTIHVRLPLLRLLFFSLIRWSGRHGFLDLFRKTVEYLHGRWPLSAML